VTAAAKIREAVVAAVDAGGRKKALLAYRNGLGGGVKIQLHYSGRTPYLLGVPGVRGGVFAERATVQEGEVVPR
jgi:hypothetical protein